jgi:hypothetical protein
MYGWESTYQGTESFPRAKVTFKKFSDESEETSSWTQLAWPLLLHELYIVHHWISGRSQLSLASYFWCKPWASRIYGRGSSGGWCGLSLCGQVVMTFATYLILRNRSQFTRNSNLPHRSPNHNFCSPRHGIWLGDPITNILRNDRDNRNARIILVAFVDAIL